MSKKWNEKKFKKYRKKVSIKNLGLYHVYWKAGSSSLASIGMKPNGKFWIAPTNWVKPATLNYKIWSWIERIEEVHCNEYDKNC